MGCAGILWSVQCEDDDFEAFLGKKKTIYWASLTEEARDRRFVAEAMAELLDALSVWQLAPVIEPLPEDLEEILVPHLRAPDIEGCVRAIQEAGAGQPFGVSIYCDPRQPAACAARERLAHAQWGLSMKGIFSLTYCAGNKWILWHETLHLLGAQDHYSLKEFETTCELPTCIMQYAPSELTVGERPCLCQETLGILRRSCGDD